MVRKSVIQPSFARSGGDCHAAPVSQRYRQDSWLRGHDLRTAESRGGVSERHMPCTRVRQLNA